MSIEKGDTVRIRSGYDAYFLKQYPQAKYPALDGREAVVHWVQHDGVRVWVDNASVLIPYALIEETRRETIPVR